MNRPSLIAQEWTFHTTCSETVDVLPDGCRDLIVVTCGDRRRWFTTDLTDTSYGVSIDRNVQMRGVRFAPGVVVRHGELDRYMLDRDPEEVFLGDTLLAFVHRPDGLAEILTCLAAGTSSMTQKARQLSITPRTLQRTVRAATGRSPRFWNHLARVRHAARALLSASTLADIAHEHEYADQAHLSRDIKRWMGVTPLQFRCDVQRRAAIVEPAYGS